MVVIMTLRPPLVGLVPLAPSSANADVLVQLWTPLLFRRSMVKLQGQVNQTPSSARELSQYLGELFRD